MAVQARDDGLSASGRGDALRRVASLRGEGRYREAVRLCGEEAQRTQDLDLLNQWAHFHRLLGEDEQAFEVQRTAVAVAEQAGDPKGLARQLRIASAFFRERGKGDVARGLLERALRLAEVEYGETHLEVFWILMDLARPVPCGDYYSREYQCSDPVCNEYFERLCALHYRTYDVNDEDSRLERFLLSDMFVRRGDEETALRLKEDFDRAPGDERGESLWLRIRVPRAGVFATTLAFWLRAVGRARRDSETREPMVRIVQVFVTQALNSGATEMHIEHWPRSDPFLFMAEGELRDLHSLPQPMWPSLCDAMTRLAFRRTGLRGPAPRPLAVEIVTRSFSGCGQCAPCQKGSSCEVETVVPGTPVFELPVRRIETEFGPKWVIVFPEALREPFLAWRKTPPDREHCWWFPS